MRAGLVDAIVRGHVFPWALIAVLWAIVALVLLLQRRGLPGPGRVLLLLGAAAATSLIGLVAAQALSLPQVRWRTDPTSQLLPRDLFPHGVVSWRSLHGPAVEVQVDGLPDIAIPAIDPAGRWVLMGLFSDRPVDGLPPAPETTPPEGAPRLCPLDGGACRAWPATWPAPSPPGARAGLAWSKDPTGAVAYEVETGRYVRPRVGDGAPALELIGDLSAGAPRSGAPAVQLVILRRIAAGRFTAVRLLARTGATPPVVVQRIDASLTAGPTARAAVLPPLLLGVAAFPIGALLLLVAPAWLSARLRRRGAVLRELSAPLPLDPLLPGASVAAVLGPEAAADRRWIRLAAVREDADLGDALLPAGTVVHVACAADDAPITSRLWHELPPAAPADCASGEPPSAGAAVLHEERGSLRRVGVLVPADPAPFREAARAWLSLALYPLAVVLTGLAAAAPAVVAVVALLAG